eukprot:m.169483 g.169483  ORF g.169483 m.169483 type:complete len:344 (+) comp18244_c0_seq3:231-1262(+)
MVPTPPNASDVRGKLNYVKRGNEALLSTQGQPYFFAKQEKRRQQSGNAEDETPTEAAPQVARGHYVKIDVQISNARNLGRQCHLDVHGFQLFNLPTDVVDWRNVPHVRRVYPAEIKSFMKTLHPTATVIVPIEHILRSALPSTDNYVNRPHSDFAQHSYLDSLCHGFVEEVGVKSLGLVKILKHHGVTPLILRSNRVVVYNIWRSISPFSVQRNPLAVCDARSVDPNDLCAIVGLQHPAKLIPEKPIFDFNMLYFNPKHKWYYFPQMTSNEAIVFKAFDSHPPGGTFMPTMHTAFDVPFPEGAPLRESCDIRCICILPIPDAHSLVDGQHQRTDTGGGQLSKL